MSGKTEAISIRRGLSIYKQPLQAGRGSPYWYARVYMPLGGRNIHAKSTGTTDVRAAKARAEEYWTDCAIRQRTGDVFPVQNRNRDPNDASFDHVAERWLETRKIAAGSDPAKIRSWADDNSAYLKANGLAAFFCRRDVNTITTDDIRRFLLFEVEKSAKGKLASATQKRTLVTLRCILKSGFERRLLAAIPLLPKIKVDDNPRKYFTRPEYRRLYRTAWIRAKKARDKGDRAEFDHWMEMADFVIFMVSTFLRPSEWKAIRFRDVVVVDTGQTPHIQIIGKKGKTGFRQFFSMPEAIAPFKRLLERAGKDPEAYLFKNAFQNRQTAGEKMRDSFERLLRAAGMKAPPGGRDRVSYCLRHSAIMFRILEGDNVDLLLLAKAAGTSVDQIERFYGSHLEVGMKLENLQSVRR